MGRFQRQKGKRGEIMARNYLRLWGFSESRRGQQFRGGPDSPDIIGFPGTHWEVKAVERLSMSVAMDQAIAEAPMGSIPCVMSFKNRKPALVVIRASDIPGFVSAFIEGVGNGTKKET